MAKKAIFLDRDDTLIDDPGYINNPDQVKLLNGVAAALVDLRAMGYKLIVVSNQSGVARGIVTEKVLIEIHKRMEQLLAEKGASLDAIYYCPYHPNASVAKYRKKSDHRKPAPGMLLEAADELDIDLGESWMIGNRSHDVDAGLKAGCKTILLDNPTHDKHLDFGTSKPDHRAVNMREAVNIIKKYSRTQNKLPAKAKKPKIAEDKNETKTSRTSKTADTPLPIKPPEHQNPSPQSASAQKTEILLTDILEQLRKTHRVNMFDEFSIMRLFAGILQVAVIFCLLISLRFLIGPPPRPDSLIFISLGFAVVLQLMALTFFIMHREK